MFQTNDIVDVLLGDGQYRRGKIMRGFLRDGQTLYEVINVEDQQTIYTVAAKAMRKVL